MTLILSGTDGLSDIDGSAATPAIRGTDTNTGIFFPAADTIAFSEGGVESVRIDSSGNVGIGTSSPGQKLTVNGGLTVLAAATLPAAQGTMLFSYESAVNRCYMGDGTGYSFAFSKRAASTTTDLMTLTDAGNFAVGGGTISGRSAFYNGNNLRPVSIGSGNIYMQAETGGWAMRMLCLGSSGTNRGGFGFAGSNDSLTAYTVGTEAGTGVQLASGATSWTTWSDIRDKNVVGQVQNGLDAVNALEPLYFLYKNDEPGQRQRIGFSAQNVQSVIPEAVVELEKNPENPTEDSKRLALSMTDMIPVLVKAIQEQQAIIQSLTARIEALEGK